MASLLRCIFRQRGRDAGFVFRARSRTQSLRDPARPQTKRQLLASRTCARAREGGSLDPGCVGPADNALPGQRSLESRYGASPRGEWVRGRVPARNWRRIAPLPPRACQTARGVPCPQVSDDDASKEQRMIACYRGEKGPVLRSASPAFYQADAFRTLDGSRLSKPKRRDYA